MLKQKICWVALLYFVVICAVGAWPAVEKVFVGLAFGFFDYLPFSLSWSLRRNSYGVLSFVAFLITVSIAFFAVSQVLPKHPVDAGYRRGAGYWFRTAATWTLPFLLAFGGTPTPELDRYQAAKKMDSIVDGLENWMSVNQDDLDHDETRNEFIRLKVLGDNPDKAKVFLRCDPIYQWQRNNIPVSACTESALWERFVADWREFRELERIYFTKEPISPWVFLQFIALFLCALILSNWGARLSDK